MLIDAPALRRRRLVAGLPAWCVVAAVARAEPVEPMPPPVADVPPAKVTSDSPEFCAQLADQLRQERHARDPAPVPEEVRLLSAEGKKMCHEGHLRPGILRLRRALQILRGE